MEDPLAVVEHPGLGHVVGEPLDAGGQQRVLVTVLPRGGQPEDRLHRVLEEARVLGIGSGSLELHPRRQRAGPVVEGVLRVLVLRLQHPAGPDHVAAAGSTGLVAEGLGGGRLQLVGPLVPPLGVLGVGTLDEPGRIRGRPQTQIHGGGALGALTGVGVVVLRRVALEPVGGVLARVEDLGALLDRLVVRLEPIEVLGELVLHPQRPDPEGLGVDLEGEGGVAVGAVGAQDRVPVTGLALMAHVEVVVGLHHLDGVVGAGEQERVVEEGAVAQPVLAVGGLGGGVGDDGTGLAIGGGADQHQRPRGDCPGLGVAAAWQPDAGQPPVPVLVGGLLNGREPGVGVGSIDDGGEGLVAGAGSRDVHGGGGGVPHLGARGLTDGGGRSGERAVGGVVIGVGERRPVDLVAGEPGRVDAGLEPDRGLVGGDGDVHPVGTDGALDRRLGDLGVEPAGGSGGGRGRIEAVGAEVQHGPGRPVVRCDVGGGEVGGVVDEGVGDRGGARRPPGGRVHVGVVREARPLGRVLHVDVAGEDVGLGMHRVTDHHRGAGEVVVRQLGAQDPGAFAVVGLLDRRPPLDLGEPRDLPLEGVGQHESGKGAGVLGGAAVLPAAGAVQEVDVVVEAGAGPVQSREHPGVLEIGGEAADAESGPGDRRAVQLGELLTVGAQRPPHRRVGDPEALRAGLDRVVEVVGAGVAPGIEVSGVGSRLFALDGHVDPLVGGRHVPALRLRVGDERDCERDESQDCDDSGLHDANLRRAHPGFLHAWRLGIPDPVGRISRCEGRIPPRSATNQSPNHSPTHARSPWPATENC